MRRRNLLPLTVAALSSPSTVHCSRSTDRVANGDEGLHRAGDAAAIEAPIDLPPPPEAGALASPFHVFVTDRHTSDESIPSLHLCPLSGATWLCGIAEVLVVRNGTAEREPAFEVGLPKQDDWVDGEVQVLGHWPDNAWLVLARFDVPPPITFAIYRWYGDRWRVAVPAFSTTDMGMSVVPWGKGGALMVHHVGPGEVALRGLGALSGAHPRLAPMPGCKGFSEKVGYVLPFEDGSITATVPDPCAETDVVERWSSPSSGPRVQRLPLRDGATTVLAGGMSGDTPDDVTVWGTETRWISAGKRAYFAYLAHYDGHVWTKLGVPPELTSVNSWVRNAKGTAWMIAQDHQDPDHSALWMEASADPWKSVALPAICDPVKVSKAADESIWVECWDHADLMLLSTATPSRVVQFGLRKPPGLISP